MKCKQIKGLNNIIEHSLERYPTLYGKSRLKVLEHALFTNGNGMEWVDGELVTTSYTKKEKRPTWEEVLEKAAVLAEKDFTENEYSQNWEVDIIGMYKHLQSPIHWYTLDTGNYSKIGHLPDNITDEWLTASAQMLLYMLHFRQEPREPIYINPENSYESYKEEETSCNKEHNHANALTLLIRYEQKFGQREAWRKVIDHPEFIAPYYQDAKFWEIRERRHKRLLELNCKFYSQERDEFMDYQNEFDTLTAEEYLDYHEVDCTGFEEHKELLKKVRHQKWMHRTFKLKNKMLRHQEKEKIRKAVGNGEIKDGVLIVQLIPELEKSVHCTRLMNSI